MSSNARETTSLIIVTCLLSCSPRTARVIAPKKTAAVRAAKTKQKQTASITARIEQEMVGRASKGGPLTIMKKAADGDADDKKKNLNKK